MYGEAYQERETRVVQHVFLSEVWVWYSEEDDTLHGYNIYVNDSGVRFKGTRHTPYASLNPYPPTQKDARLIGSAISLIEMVDVSLTRPSPIHSGIFCDVLALFDSVYYSTFLERITHIVSKRD